MKVNLFSEAEMLNNFGEGIWAVYRQQSSGLQEIGIEVLPNKMWNDKSDVVHIHSFGPLSYIKASLTRKPVVISTHTLPNEVNGSVVLAGKMAKLFSFYLPHFYSKGDVLVAPSEFTKNALKTYSIDSPVHVVSNGVDTKKFRFSKARRDSFRKRYGIGKNDVVVYGVGQIIMRKGIDKFIRMAKKFPAAKFVWVGRRPFGMLSGNNKELRELLADAPSNLLFTGYVDDIVGAHSAGDIFFMPTMFENECIALLEAASVGKPIVVSDIPVFQTWLFHGRNSMKGHSEKELESSLKKLIENKAMRAKFGREAERMAHSRDIRLISKKLADIYSKTGKMPKKEINITLNEKLYLAFAFSLFAMAGMLIFVKDKVLAKKE